MKHKAGRSYGSRRIGSRWSGRFARYAWFVVVLAGWPLSACPADDYGSAIDDLKARLAAVEEQNRVLLERLNGQPPAAGATQPAGGFDAQYNQSLAAQHNQTLVTGISPVASFEAGPPPGEGVLCPPAAPSLPYDGPSMTAKWGTSFNNNGLWFTSPDKDFKLHFGGSWQMDATGFLTPNRVANGAGGIGEIPDGVDPRRLRWRFDGSMYENLQFLVEADFVNSATASTVTSVPALIELWVNYSGIPWLGNVRIGNQREPWGFERMMSTRFLDFMERSFNEDAFYSPANNDDSPGIDTFNAVLDERMTWSFGVFKNLTNPYGYDLTAEGWAETGRLTVLPIYADDGTELVHLGVSGRNLSLNGGQVRYRVRGMERPGLSAQWPLYADTGVISGESQQDVNFELVSVLGPWTLQAEWNLNFVQQAALIGGPDVGTLFYQGAYCELAYFLTGEHRQYTKSVGLFDRVVPLHNASFGCDKKDENRGGIGAWQLACRYSFVNLNDKGINGGYLSDWTFGLNWYLNPNLKIQWNYSLTSRDSATGESDGLIQGFGTRVAFDL